MASRSILASAPAIEKLPSPSPGELHGMLHELIGHPLGNRAPVQGDQMDSIVPILPARGWGEGTGTLPAGGPGCC